MTAPVDDPRLTAYALGELSAAEAAEVSKRIASDPAARAVVEAVRSMAEALAAQPADASSRLDPARREEVRRTAAAMRQMSPPPAPRVPSPGSPRAQSPFVGGSMPKLQACPKCGAQFDVSAFAPGQKFTCGACGTVVTAGAPAPAVAGRAPGSVRSGPGAPAAPVGKAPGSRSGTSAASPVGHGPQYRPVDRGSAAASAAADRKKPDRSRRVRETDVGDRRKSNTPLILGAVGLLVVAGVGAFLVLGGKKKDGDADSAKTTPVAGRGTGPGTSGAGTTTPAPVASDSLEAVEAEFKQKPDHTSKELATFLKRYKAIDSAPAKERAKAVAEELIRYGDKTQQAAIDDAHRTLGHLDFHEVSKNQIPEEIAYYNEPFIRAVQDANQQRWFTDAESFEIAKRSWTKTAAHAQRLGSDRVYRALNDAKANIARDDDFKSYNYATYFASPYLIFYSSKDEMDEADMMKMTKAERAKQMAELEAKKKKWNKILAEKGKIYTQLYQYFMKRYGEECELKDLMAEYGGRPDYPKSKRSFADGVPLIIWIFSDREAFDYHHKKQLKDKDQSTGLENVAGYFSPKTGWVYLYDEPSRQFEIDKNVHEGTHQLEYWFQRQKNEWATQFHTPQSFFGEGIAEYIGSVEMKPDRTLRFIGINRSRLKSWQEVMKSSGREGGKLPIFPLQDLVRFEGYAEAQGYAATKLGIQPDFGLHIFYCESWALVYFLNDYKDGKYRKKFNLYLNDILNYDYDKERYGYESFKKQFGLRSEGDWKALDKEFRDFFVNDLKKIKAQDVAEQAPDRDDWPGFVDPEETDQSNPEAASTPTEK